MSEAVFEPKIVAYVCNWCTYLGADLAGTNRLEYPSNVRIVRLPCTGRIDFNLIIKAFEIGADAVHGLRMPSWRLPLHVGQLPRSPPMDAVSGAAGHAGDRDGSHPFHLDIAAEGQEVAAGDHRDHREDSRTGSLPGLPGNL